MSRRTRASADQAPPPPSAVQILRPDPEVWGIARLWAGGDVSRLRVLDDRTVLVLNSPA